MSDGAWQQEQERSLRALRSLAGKEPPRQVRQRIVEGALARRARPAFPWARAFTGLALAGAAAAVSIVVLRPDVPAPGDRAAVAEVTQAVVGMRGDAGHYGVGPHRVEVAGGGSVHFDAVDPGAAELRVAAGRATFEVEPLGAGESFRVRTDQVLVEVVGTRFEVGVEGNCSRVAVTEGRVRVTGPDGISELGVGDSARFCARPAGVDALVREAVVLVSRGEDLGRAVELLERYRTLAAGGPLEEEALFYLTLARARQGEHAKAAALARTFRERFPESPRVERLELWLGRAAD